MRQTITVDAQMKLASLQETVTVSGASPTVDVENTKVGARLSQEILTAVPTSRTIFGSTTVLPGMTMGRQDPGGLNAATSTGMTAHGAGNYNLNYYGVTADTPQNYGSMYYMDFGSAEEISVDTAAMGAEVGGGGGANINVIPKSGGNTVKGDALYSITGKGIWDHFTGNNINDDLRAQGITDPTLQFAEGLQCQRRRSVRERSPLVVRVVPQLHARSKRHRPTHGQCGRQPHQPVRFEPAQLHDQRQVSSQQEQPAVDVLDLQPKVPAAPRRGRRAAASARDAAPGVAEEPDQRQLDLGDGPEHVPGSVVDLLPYALAEQLGRRVQRAVGEPAASVDVQHRHRHLYRRPGADRPALPRRVSPSDERRDDPLHRRIPRREPSAEDRVRKLVDADRAPIRFNVFNDVRLRYTGPAATCSPTVRTGCTPSEVFLYNTPLTQKTKMTNYAAFVQDRASYNRITLNLGLRYSHFDGLIPAQSNGGAEWGAACAACNQSFPEIKPPFAGTRSRRARASWSS